MNGYSMVRSVFRKLLRLSVATSKQKHHPASFLSWKVTSSVSSYLSDVLMFFAVPLAACVTIRVICKIFFFYLILICTAPYVKERFRNWTSVNSNLWGTMYEMCPLPSHLNQLAKLPHWYTVKRCIALLVSLYCGQVCWGLYAS